MELEWGPVARDIHSRPAIVVAFGGLKPGLGVRLQLPSRPELGRELGRSKREVVPHSGSVMIAVEVPRDRLSDPRLSLALLDADQPGQKLWVGEYWAEKAPALHRASEAVTPASTAPAEFLGRPEKCRTKSLCSTCASCAELKIRKSG